LKTVDWGLKGSAPLPACHCYVGSSIIIVRALFLDRPLSFVISVAPIQKKGFLVHGQQGRMVMQVRGVPSNGDGPTAKGI